MTSDARFLNLSFQPSLKAAEDLPAGTIWIKFCFRSQVMKEIQHIHTITTITTTGLARKWRICPAWRNRVEILSSGFAQLLHRPMQCKHEEGDFRSEGETSHYGSWKWGVFPQHWAMSVTGVAEAFFSWMWEWKHYPACWSQTPSPQALAAICFLKAAHKSGSELQSS